MTTTETVADRLSRLAVEAPSEKRLESLAIAHEAGVTDDLFRKLAEATRLYRSERMTLPALHYESLSRGRGWCRLGKGESAQWAERTDKGYEVGPGRWTVGATDGFSRKDSVTWDVRHVTVGEAVWTIAN